MSSKQGMKGVLPVAALCAALAGCAHDPSGQRVRDTTRGAAEIQTFVFECPDGFGFVARIEGDKAWLFLPDGTIQLPRANMETGSSYARGSTGFNHEGGKASIDTGAHKHAGCVNNRARAIWEHAKLNGVGFRATGNEPGWYLEITNEQDILLVTDYGNSRYRFDSSAMTSDPHSRTTVYSAHTGTDRLEIVIEGAPCKDTMSGEAFPASVSVRLNDRRISGCGRALH